MCYNPQHCLCCIRRRNTKEKTSDETIFERCKRQEEEERVRRRCNVSCCMKSKYENIHMENLGAHL